MFTSPTSPLDPTALSPLVFHMNIVPTSSDASELILGRRAVDQRERWTERITTI